MWHELRYGVINVFVMSVVVVRLWALFNDIRWGCGAFSFFFDDFIFRFLLLWWIVSLSFEVVVFGA